MLTSDQLNLLSKFTFPRIVNALQIKWSYHYSKWTKKAKITGLPTSITIEPTTACNLGCPECPSGLKQFTRPEGNLTGTKNILKWKKELKSKTPYLIFQFLVVKPNEHQIDDAKKLADELGVDEIRFKTAQLYDFENGNELMPSIEKYARYKKQADGTYRLKNKLLNECWRMWSSCVITWDGKIVPCCFDKDAKHQLGDIAKTDLQQIWTSAPYNNFRSTLLTNRQSIDICQNCTEGTKVWE